MTNLKHKLLKESLLGKDRKSIGNKIGSNRTAKWIIMALRHYAPPVIYVDSPLSYMSEGAAKRFYQGQQDNCAHNADDPHVISYYAIKTHHCSHGCGSNIEEQSETTSLGCRLVGIIPCSDAFGVDFLID